MLILIYILLLISKIFILPETEIAGRRWCFGSSGRLLQPFRAARAVCGVFLKLGDPFGGPYNKDYSILGSIIN